MENGINKPLSVAHAEFVSDLLLVINNSGLPPFIIESVLKDIYFDVRVLAGRQLEMDKKNYKEAMRELDE